ncbi:hypothetical protein G5V57_11935 [Nordella sp. HKS 07]|uniref:hypothetical protein n=1 Tax=Nordella sp. HKS 07 TaxID=2712222 RepID=UPI0013E1FEA5|nr:hypothetical protein [Nordella sp. HKS 07]QIG48370.1 hypothetical protein G5V57_11935 [Nordella sp. HKS 07]
MVRVVDSYCLGWVIGAAFVLALPSSIHAETRYAEHGALLAISLDQGRMSAGMMCYANYNADSTQNPPNSQRADSRRGDMCRRSNSSNLNSDILAFDVTSWTRQAISELADRLLQMEDPMNYDFTKARVAGRPVRRIDESWDDPDLHESVFEFSSGCYLLMQVAPLPLLPRS